VNGVGDGNYVTEWVEAEAVPDEVVGLFERWWEEGGV
jgi:hypothetical protein